MDKIVHIEWVDSCHDGDWQSRERADRHGIVQCNTVGYLLKKSREEVVVYQSRSSSGNVTDMMAIPRVAIRKMYYLEDRDASSK